MSPYAPPKPPPQAAKTLVVEAADITALLAWLRCRLGPAAVKGLDAEAIARATIVFEPGPKGDPKP